MSVMAVVSISVQSSENSGRFSKSSGKKKSLFSTENENIASKQALYLYWGQNVLSYQLANS